MRCTSPVALLAEGVDRNSNQQLGAYSSYRVALLAEGVDRNAFRLEAAPRDDVALLAEGVDRNNNDLDANLLQIRRPPRGGRG